MDAAVQYERCRICMRITSNRILIGLFEHIMQAQSLATVVSLVCAVEVRQDDELPQVCCMQCLREVEAALKLRILCQESDVILRRHLADKAAVAMREPFSDGELNSQDQALQPGSEEFLQNKLESHLPNNAAVVKNEPFCDDELNSQDPGSLASGNEVPEQNAPNGLKYEYEEITIEDTHLIDANYRPSNQCSESKNSISDDVEESSSNNQKLQADDSENIQRKTNNHYHPKKAFDKCPAVKFGCCGCMSSFDTFDELRAHGREKHRGTDLENITLKNRQCDICFKVFRRNQSFDFHRGNLMYNYRCKICDEILITLTQALVHSRKHARAALADEVLICCGCKMRFPSAEALQIHSKTIHLPEKPSANEKKPVACNICYRSYTTQIKLRMHKLGYLRPSKHQCKECGKICRNSAAQRNHEHSHIQEHTQTNLAADQALICCGCEMEFASAEALRVHSEAVHLPEKPPPHKKKRFACNICYRNFTTLQTLHMHKVDFSKRSKNHHCQDCEKSFRTKHAFVWHARLHANIRPFKCPQCPAAFKLKKILTSHLTTHEDQKNYPCPLCDRQFRSRTGKRYHIRTFHD